MSAPVERVIKNRLGFVKPSEIPGGGEHLNVKGQGNNFFFSFSSPQEIEILDSGEVAVRPVMMGMAAMGARPLRFAAVTVDVSKRPIEGKNWDGQTVVYRGALSEDMNFMEKLARKLHR